MLRTRLKQPHLLVLALLGLLSACTGSAESHPSGPVLVEIISLDHAPIRPTTEEASALAQEFGQDVTLVTYQFGTPEGDTFAEENGLDEHTPIAIFINGEPEFEIDGRAVQFQSFPQGGGTGIVAEGEWTFDDLRTVLTDVVGNSQGG